MKNNTEPRYLNTQKNFCYLASANENVTQLIKQEIDGLTKVLIDLKTQYDIIRRDNLNKKYQTEELVKKIDSLQKMDTKSKRKIESAEEKSASLKQYIDAKKTMLKEAEYEYKTLLNTINKLRKDCFINQKQIVSSEQKTKRLEHEIQKEKFKETQLKEKKNKVFSKIMSQTSKNEFYQKEHRLQLQYYRTIILQKNMFLQSEEERKRGQLEIADKAKNESADKQEEQKRKQLMLIKFYNIYLDNEMQDYLTKNQKLEETYRQIRDICGTPSLKTITDKILYKDKKYNESVQEVSVKLNKIETLEKDIAEKKQELIQLKNNIFCREENDKDKKIDTINTPIIQEDENKIIQEEQDLLKVMKELQEKNTQIDLTYKKVIENIDNFDKERSMVKQSEIRAININETTDFTSLNNDILIEKGNETKADEEKNEEQNMETNSEPTPHDIENNTKANQENGDKKEKKNDQEVFIDFNSAAFTESAKDNELSMEDEELLLKYKQFLEDITKRFNMFFLCHGKLEFIQAMAEQGIKSNNEIEIVRTKTKESTTTYQTSPRLKRTKTRKDDPMKNYSKGYSEIEVDIDELKDEEERYRLTNNRKLNANNDIYLRFKEQNENVVNDFIYKNKKK